MPIDSNAERLLRRDAVNFARASVGLEGLKPSGALESQARRFINGEIDLAEFLRTDVVPASL